MWVQLAFLVVSLVLQYVLTPKPKGPEPANLEDFDLPTVDPGRKIPVIFGEVWLVDPNIVWYGDLRTEKIKEKGK